jgi:hypothetical protein
MKKNYFIKANVLLSILAVFFLVAQVAAQFENYTGASDPQGNKTTIVKPVVDYSQKYLPPSGREGGETIATAISVNSLPFNDIGYTCDNVNDYDEACPYTGSLAPDVVYSYTPSVNQYVNIDLCGSSYDTKVFVYENSYTPGFPYACNDDYYFDATCGIFVSALLNLSLTGGNTYYIVIDGYGGACGDYILNITGYTPPSCDGCISCSIPEGEGDIPDYGIDDFNAGCNAPEYGYPFSPIQLYQVICGRTNTYYNGGDFRDTDWYKITLTEAGTLYWSGYASFNLQLYILSGDCLNYTYASGLGGNCSLVSISASLPAGTYYLWAGLNVFTGVPEGKNYNVIATLNAPPPENFCDAVAPVPVSNWALYIGIALILVFAIVRFRKMV